MENNLTTQDVYQQITNRVIAAIEAGAPHFEMPWHSKAGRPRPINVHTGKPYRGINTLALWIAQLQSGFNTSTWGTYRQWKAGNAQVRKGERAAVVVFYKDMERPVKNPATGETEQERYFVANASWVFNADQVDGWNPPESSPREDKTEVLDRAETFIAASGARLLHDGGGRAYYRPGTDTIHLPKRSLFTGTSTMSATEGYYSTLLHELTHWTGHDSRLKRDLSKRFGDNAYAMEELVAELGAAFLCADLHITVEPRPDHAAYLNSWLNVLNADKRAIFTAASKASEAADYLSKLQPLEEAA